MECSIRVPADPRSPYRARRALESLEDDLPPAIFDDARLLVSELVTNSVLHARMDPEGWIEVKIMLENGDLRVEVMDPGKVFDPAPGIPEDHSSGWGLYLVDRLADRWGVNRDGETKVWFELTTPPDRS